MQHQCTKSQNKRKNDRCMRFIISERILKLQYTWFVDRAGRFFTAQPSYNSNAVLTGFLSMIALCVQLGVERRAKNLNVLLSSETFSRTSEPKTYPLQYAQVKMSELESQRQLSLDIRFNMGSGASPKKTKKSVWT